MPEASSSVSPQNLDEQIAIEALGERPDVEKLLGLMQSLAGILEKEKDPAKLEPRDQAFAVIEQRFIDLREIQGLIRLLRIKAKWTGDRPEYGSECSAVLASAAAKDRLALAKIESVSFGTIHPSESLKRLSLLLQIKPGLVVAHRSWGYGVVKAEDHYYRNVTVEFDRALGEPKALGFAFAAESLVPIGPEHILSVRHADPAAFNELCQKEPGEVVKLALQSWGNLTIAQLQGKVEGLLPAETDWKHFWEGARRQLQNDGTVRLPAAAKKATAVEFSDSAAADKETESSKEFNELKSLRAPKDILDRVAAIVKKGAGALSDAQREIIADRLAFVLKASVADRKKLGNAVKIRAILLAISAGLSTLQVQLRPGAEEDFAFVPGEPGSVDLVRTLCLPSIVLDAALKLPASQMESLVEAIPLGVDAAVASAYVQVLPVTPANLLEKIAPKLLGGLAHGEFADMIRSECQKARPSFPLLRWLCHAATDKKLSAAIFEILSPFAIVSIVGAALQSEASGEGLRMKNDIKRIFLAGRKSKESGRILEVDEGSKWLEPMLDKMSIDERASVFASLKALDGVWEPLGKRNLLDYLRKTYVGIEVEAEKASTEAVLEAFVRFGITSARTYAERQARLEKLVKEDIPQNIKEIEFAKGFGDLSENFEYQIARDKERELQARQTQLQKDLADVSAFDFSEVEQNGLVGMGSAVVVREEDGTERSYSILGEWDSDPALGIVSSRSRLAEALFGHAEGDKVALPAEDGGEKVATILSVGPLSDSILAWMRG